MQDMVNGCYLLPWDESIVHKDGSSCGFDVPSRSFIGNEQNLLEAMKDKS
jgi:formamidase